MTIEFDVDMECCMDADMLDGVILHDENGEMDDLVFVPERTCRNEAYLYSPGLLFVCSECTRATDEYEHIPLIGEYCRCGAKRVD